VNRQYKRLMKRQEAQRRAVPRPVAKAPGAPTKRERTKPIQFVREVIAELRKVAWPSRQEVVAYTIVVLVSVTVIAAMIYGMDRVFTAAVLELFGVD
jgi:preprotein translocase subunit SecE